MDILWKNYFVYFCQMGVDFYTRIGYSNSRVRKTQNEYGYAIVA